MTETPESPATDTPAPVRTPEQIARTARTRRLASALRDNLRRRKAAHAPPAKPGN
jgi:hypothetical protein